MPYFTKDYTKFFRELEKNNNKDWFHENKKRYEQAVKEPFKAFAIDMADSLERVYPGVSLDDKWKMGRINRDIRFSKDKTPYNLHMSVMVMPHGLKKMFVPGFYLQANHKDVRVYSGAHSLDKKQLEDVRYHIKDNLKEFNKLIGAAAFKRVYGDILGDKNKRLPKDFQEMEAKQPLIANKNFYWFFKMKPAVLTSETLIMELIKNYKVTMPLNRFFEKALGF